MCKSGLTEFVAELVKTQKIPYSERALSKQYSAHLLEFYTTSASALFGVSECKFSLFSGEIFVSPPPPKENTSIFAVEARKVLRIRCLDLLQVLAKPANVGQTSGKHWANVGRVGRLPSGRRRVNVRYVGQGFGQKNV